MRIATRIALAGLVAALSLTTLVADDAKDKAKGPKDVATPVSDTRLGLAPGSVFETLTPDPVVPDASDPGTKPVLARWNAVAPPMIPHGIADFLPITTEANACVDCHLVDKKVKGEPTPIPVSHKAAAKQGEDAKVAGPRWICNSCHVPLTAAKPLPASTRR